MSDHWRWILVFSWLVLSVLAQSSSTQSPSVFFAYPPAGSTGMLRLTINVLDSVDVEWDSNYGQTDTDRWAGFTKYLPLAIPHTDHGMRSRRMPITERDNIRTLAISSSSTRTRIHRASLDLPSTSPPERAKRLQRPLHAVRLNLARQRPQRQPLCRQP
jgi:hypothetical protein